MHVERLVAERDQDVTHAWGPHDFVAALSLRDFIERGASMASTEEQGQITDTVRSTDLLFQSFTEPDASGIVAKLAGVTPSPDQWWWQRIPVDGPIRIEFDAWHA